MHKKVLLTRQLIAVVNEPLQATPPTVEDLAQAMDEVLEIKSHHGIRRSYSERPPIDLLEMLKTNNESTGSTIIGNCPFMKSIQTAPTCVIVLYHEISALSSAKRPTLKRVRSKFRRISHSLEGALRCYLD